MCFRYLKALQPFIKAFEKVVKTKVPLFNEYKQSSGGAWQNSCSKKLRKVLRKVCANECLFLVNLHAYSKQLFLRDTPVHAFKFCKRFQNSFFMEHLWKATSGLTNITSKPSVGKYFYPRMTDQWCAGKCVFVKIPSNRITDVSGYLDVCLETFIELIKEVLI